MGDARAWDDEQERRCRRPLRDEWRSLRAPSPTVASLLVWTSRICPTCAAQLRSRRSTCGRWIPMRSRRVRSCVARRGDTGTGAAPGERASRPPWPRRSVLRDGDLLLRLRALELRDFGRSVGVRDGARLLEVVPHLVALIRLPAAPQVTLVAHAGDLPSRWGAHVPRSRERVKSRVVGHVMR